jgi:hypothetical protein
MVFKFATFSQEYISHYQLGVGSPGNLGKAFARAGEDLTGSMGKLNMKATEPGDERPKLTIFESKQFSLRNYTSTKAAAEHTLVILEYLQQYGPLLANRPLLAK